MDILERLFEESGSLIIFIAIILISLKIIFFVIVVEIVVGIHVKRLKESQLEENSVQNQILFQLKTLVEIEKSKNAKTSKESSEVVIENQVITNKAEEQREKKRNPIIEHLIKELQ